MSKCTTLAQVFKSCAGAHAIVTYKKNETLLQKANHSLWRNGGDALDHIFIDRPITHIMRIWIDTSHTCMANLNL